MEEYEDSEWELITRVLSGEATQDEKKEFQQWLREDPDRQTFFEALKEDWEQDPDNIEEVGNTPYLFDYESGLNRLQDKLEQEQENDRQRTLPPVLRTKKSTTWRIAASVLLIIGALSAYMTSSLWSKPIITYATSQVEQRIITLPDNSEVRLNKGSEISFNEGLTGSTRAITLEGEAFFDVTHNPERPFVIQVNSAEVHVLGTSLNVKEYSSKPDSKVMVAVKEGVVSLSRQSQGDDSKSTRISAGHLGMLAASSSDVELVATNVENYLGWMNGYLNFDGMPFGKVIRQLERIYEIDCELESPELADMKLTIHTERLQQKEVLNSIALALDLNYQENNGKIIWSKKQ